MSDVPEPRPDRPGRLVLVGLDGRGLTPEFQIALRAGQVGGLILFREDIPTLRAGADLIARARRLAPHPILVGLDEEGGFVSQIDGVPLGADGSGNGLRAMGAPAPGSLGERDDPALTEAVHQAVGRTLHAMGADIVFGPLLDVNVNPENPVIGRRSFGADPDRVIRHGLAALRGLACGGVIGCAKHFPGHGAAGLDSHTTLPEIAGAVPDLPAFAAAIGEGAPMVMSAHVYYPTLDRIRRPATRSRAVMRELLRVDLGFEGIVVSDALEMTGFGGERPEDGIAEALEAGVDLFLVARGQDRGLAVAGTLNGKAFREAHQERLHEARGRLDALIITRPPAGRDAGPPMPGPRTASDLAGVVEEAAATLTEAHGAALGPCRAPSAPLRGPWRVILPRDVPRGFLDPEAFAVGLSGLPGEVEVWGADTAGERLAAEPTGRGGSCLIVSFRRGSRGKEATVALWEAIETWRGAGEGREVVAMAAADRDPSAELPDGWGSLAMTGSHRTGVAVAESVIAAWGSG